MAPNTKRASRFSEKPFWLNPLAHSLRGTLTPVPVPSWGVLSLKIATHPFAGRSLPTVPIAALGKFWFRVVWFAIRKITYRIFCKAVRATRSKFLKPIALWVSLSSPQNTRGTRQQSPPCLAQQTEINHICFAIWSQTTPQGFGDTNFQAVTGFPRIQQIPKDRHKPA